MQQDYSIQAPLHKNQQGGYPTLQGVGYQYNSYAPNPQMGQNYQIPYPVNQPQQGFIDNYKDPVQSVASIETKIQAGFCCYTCLTYYELITNLIFVYFACHLGMTDGYSALSFTSIFMMVLACVFAIWAKASLSPIRQNIALCLFSVSVVLGVLSSLFIAINFYELAQTKCPYNDDTCGLWGIGTAIDEFVAIGATMNIALQIGFGVILVTNGYQLLKLMRERKAILVDSD